MKVVNIINQLYLRMSIVKINLKVLSIGQCNKIEVVKEYNNIVSKNNDIVKGDIKNKYFKELSMMN